MAEAYSLARIHQSALQHSRTPIAADDADQEHSLNGSSASEQPLLAPAGQSAARVVHAQRKLLVEPEGRRA